MPALPVAVQCSVLEAIYDHDFLSRSYGFRQGRSGHIALQDLRSLRIEPAGGDIRIVFVIPFGSKNRFGSRFSAAPKRMKCCRPARSLPTISVFRFRYQLGSSNSVIRGAKGLCPPQAAACVFRTVRRCDRAFRRTSA
jgi:hypothetical protein